MKTLSNYEMNAVSGGFTNNGIRSAAHFITTTLVASLAGLATFFIAYEAGLDNIDGKRSLASDSDNSFFLGYAVSLAVIGLSYYNMPGDR